MKRSNPSDDKQTRRIVHVGETYGKITVLAHDTSHGYPRHLIRCECGNEYLADGSAVFKAAETGCRKCVDAERRRKRIADMTESEVGKKYGKLTILEFCYSKFSGMSTQILAAKCRCECGTEFITPFSRIKSGGCRSCGHDSRYILKDGQEKHGKGNVKGTNVYSLNQQISKNNTSGHKGVSRIRSGKATGYYRAYITFRRHQYSLGVHKNLDDAVRARKEAEEKIYGNFLFWYNEKYGKNNDAEPPK